MSKVPDADFAESNDFSPSYASWNSALFESSVILTVWEHAAELIGDDHVAFLHSDIEPHFGNQVWHRINAALDERPYRAVGLVAPITQQYIWTKWQIPDTAMLSPKYDPMMLHAFDHSIMVWDLIKKHDRDLFEWAMDEQPKLVYAHQFACSRKAFDALGAYLYKIASQMPMRDAGLWTPHMFERLIALYLARFGGEPLLTTSFWHHASSGVYGPGSHSLYGSRPFRYYSIKHRSIEALVH